MLFSRTNFVATASADGHLKFWKKQELGIECASVSLMRTGRRTDAWKSNRFVKHYRTHLTPIVALAVSDDGRSLASLGTDSIGTVVVNGEAQPVKGSAKIFDVENFGKSDSRSGVAFDLTGRRYQI